MRRLLNEARALEAQARDAMAKVPTFARVSYPVYVKSAENFCERLTKLVGDLEKEVELYEKEFEGIQGLPR